TICQTSGKERAPGAARISAGLNKGPLLGGSHKATFFRRWFFTCLKIWALLLSGRAVIVHRANKNAFHKEGADLAT
ncbi:hypothetical protein, partial [Vibrio navarrensis]|uniref:hypothetical protein n=1 Tax=Vibrio navarrensis TaxID=29495 RepID=UPI001D047605